MNGDVKKRTLVMVAGFNQPPSDCDHLFKGRDGIPGLEAYGFECVTFDREVVRLRERIDRFAEFLTILRSERPDGGPFVLAGYSLGGLVVRGFLRAYPERSHEVDCTAMIAAPNWGLSTAGGKQLAQVLGVPDRGMDDLDLDSDFMRWLNGTGGHWENGVWILDAEPWVGPPGARLLTIQGLIPARGGDNDGLVWGDSSTLGSRIPAQFIIGRHCNHMNVIGNFDPLVFALKQFVVNNRVWPHTVRAIARLAGVTQPLAHAAV